MIQSGGILTKAPRTIWEGTTPFHGWGALGLGRQWYGYGELYAKQEWVYVLVKKRAQAVARLPLKVYKRDDLNRPEVPDSPYARLLKNPNPRFSRYFFWLYVSSTLDVYGEVFLGKLRDIQDPGGRPHTLVPFHPTAMRVDEKPGKDPVWSFDNGQVRVENIRPADLIHGKTYNPNDPHRGLSPLEPLRRTLEFEDAAQRAQSSFWRKGARPAMTLEHPKELSAGAGTRLKVQWDQIASGADNVGTTVVLEEGMKATPIQIPASEAQYIESRKLNREEVCAAYDMPPSAVQIMDRATFSNIVENLRSVYRDTMAPPLKFLEDMLEHQLRGAVQPGRNEPDFGDEVYAEFLLDEVLRGDFEARATAYQQADWMTIAEKRQRENLPFIEGTDRILVNTASLPLDAIGYDAAARMVAAGFDPEASLDVLDLEPVPFEEPAAPAVTIPAETVRALLGRLSRQKTLADIDADWLVDGLNGEADYMRALLNASRSVGEDLATFRRRVRALGKEQP